MGANRLTIATFNYDVSLEVYLCETLAVRIGKKAVDKETREIVARLPIHHIYGSLGPVEEVHGEGRRYGYIGSSQKLQEMASGSSTCFESPSQDAIEATCAAIYASRNVYFLGFGFSEENLRNLGLDSCLPDGVRVIASILGANGAEDRLRALMRDGMEFTTVNANPDVAPAVTSARSMFQGR